ncbi:MAG: hypothetical protein WKF97_20580 [Chitinophagaceae bacterium]
MITKKMLVIFFLFSVVFGYSQKNFQVIPEKPKAGDLITIIYEPAGDIANTVIPVEGVVYLQGSRDQTAEDMILKKDGKKYTSTVQTEGQVRFKSIGFNGSDDKLISELTAMIEMDSDASKKAF